MSTIVKGMKIPDNCFECPCCRHDNMNGVQKEQCNLTLDVFDAGYYERFESRAHNCPLVELPEKHGRLIDADAYVSMMEGKCDYEKALDPYVLSICRGGIKLMPTIVEAEGEGDEKE